MLTPVNEDKTKDIKPFENTEKEKELIKKIDEYDSALFGYLAKLYEALNGEKMDFDKIKNAVDALALFNKKQEYNYLNNLLHPEKCKGVKIPSPIPVPSCAFQLHNTVTLSTNSNGVLGFIFNPFYLGNKTQIDTGKAVLTLDADHDLTGNVTYTTTAWLNNDDTLDGSSVNRKWRPINIGQDIPNVYDQYRLVSASIVVKYIGRLDIASGVIGGAIMFDENPTIGANLVIASTNTPTANPDLIRYGNFDLAMDSFYHQENMIIEGMRELYFPLDNSFEEYVKLNDVHNWKIQLSEEDSSYTMKCQQDYYKAGFNFFIYTLNAPPSSACLKLDIYCNYECLPNAQFLNYLPLSMNAMGVSSQEKKRANLIVQQKPVMSLKDGESQQLVGQMPSIWDKMKRKFANALPSIGKMVAKGLIGMIPGLKPGLALANAFIDTNTASSMEEEVE